MKLTPAERSDIHLVIAALTESRPLGFVRNRLIGFMHRLADEATLDDAQSSCPRLSSQPSGHSGLRPHFSSLGVQGEKSAIGKSVAEVDNRHRPIALEPIRYSSERVADSGDED